MACQLYYKYLGAWKKAELFYKWGGIWNPMIIFMKDNGFWKGGPPLEMETYEDAYKGVMGSWENNTSKYVDMSPEPFIVSVESGIVYDIYGNMTAATTIITDYSDADKAVFATLPVWIPLVEEIRIETNEGTLLSHAFGTHTFEPFSGQADLYIRARNINGSSSAKHFIVNGAELPIPRHDKLFMNIRGDYAPKTVPHLEICPIPFLVSVEGGVNYDLEGNMSSVTTIITDYTDEDKAVYNSRLELKPTRESVRIEQGDTIITSYAVGTHIFERFTGPTNIFIRAKNVNGSSREVCTSMFVEGLPTPKHDRVYFQRNGSYNESIDVLEISPIPIIIGAEGGVSYDVNGDMTSVTTVYTDYSDADKAVYNSRLELKPTKEYIRVEQGESIQTSINFETHTFERFEGLADFYVRSKNVNGSSNERHVQVLATGLPNPRHDKAKIQPTDSDGNTSTHFDMSPMPIITKVEEGYIYGVNGTPSAGISVYTHYSSLEETVFSAKLEYRPTEHLKAVQGATELTSYGNKKHDFVGLSGEFNLYIRTRNPNGSSLEHSFDIAPTVLPTIHHEIAKLEIHGSYKENISYS